METDGTAGGVPAEGAPDQGTTDSEQQGGSIFDPYLQAVPEASRPIVQGYLKDAEKHVNSKLSEAAELQKRFGDFKDIDLSGVQPDQLSSVLTFIKEVGSSPEAYQAWLRDEATEAGLIEAQRQEAEQPTGDDSEQELEAYIQSRIDQALNPVTEKLSQFEQRTQEDEQAKVQADLEKGIESSFEKIEKENNIKLSDEQQEAILALGEQVESDDFVEQGFAKLRALEGGAQTGLVKDKASQPATPLRAGGQPAAAKPKTFADVREQALEIARQAL